MLSLLFVCCGVIKFHLSPTHTYTSSTFPIDHDSVMINQFTNKNQNALRRRSTSTDRCARTHPPIKACCVYSMLNDSSINNKSPHLAYSFSHGISCPFAGFNTFKDTGMLAINKNEICVAEIA